ncbi:MAG: DUF2029 domain-containing protein [Proteobacteria bacterium]|nr:DUF2029 domain-containing protein [Pseudomonadota bacterium]
MNKALRLARRDVPLGVALPWLTLPVAIPLWLVYIQILSKNIFISVDGTILPDTAIKYSPLNNDMMLFWPVAHLVTSGHAGDVYNTSLFSTYLRLHFGGIVPSYYQCPYLPPGLLAPLILAPFGILPGFLVWTLVLTGGSIWLLRLIKAPWPVVGFGLTSVASIYNMLAGQLGLITGTLFLVGLFSIASNPNRAGTCFGCLIIKPQAGLLAPIALLARRQYRTIIVSGLVVLALCVLTTLICGAAIWPAYLDEGTASARKILIAPFPNQYEDNGASVFWMMRSFGAGVTTSGIVQTATAVGATVWCWVAWRRDTKDHLALITLTAALTILATPYGYTVDLCGFTLMTGWLAWERRQLELADVLIWVWPAICPLVATGLHMELTPLILLLGAIRAWRRLDGIGTTAPACYPVPL